MLKKRAWIVLMTACMILGVYGMAVGLPIMGSKHDFSISGGGNFGGANFQLANGAPVEEICVFCHTPHNAAAPGAFLWNRTGTVATGYTMYSSSTLTSAINMGTAPTGLTLLCMSCHDGITSIAVGTLINAPYYVNGRQQVVLSDPVNGYSKIGDLYNGTIIGWGANIGNKVPGVGDTIADLSNDHPVSFTWVSGITGIKEPTSTSTGAWATGPELKLFGGRMECSTCHNVHDSATQPFLRMSNVSSNMCLACHNK